MGARQGNAAISLACSKSEVERRFQLRKQCPRLYSRSGARAARTSTALAGRPPSRGSAERHERTLPPRKHFFMPKKRKMFNKTYFSSAGCAASTLFSNTSIRERIRSRVSLCAGKRWYPALESSMFKSSIVRMGEDTFLMISKELLTGTV